MAARGTLRTMASGLNPMEGDGVVEKVGPLAAFVVYVAAIAALAFDIVPNPAGIVGLIGLLGPVVGAWAAKLGT